MTHPGSVEQMSRGTSDHSPLLFQHSSPPRPVPSSFRFQTMWVSRPDLLEVVKPSWCGPISGYGMLRFSLKLRRLKKDLSHWNKLKFGNVLENIKSAEATLKEKEALYDTSGCTDDLVVLKAQACHLRALAEGL